GVQAGIPGRLLAPGYRRQRALTCRRLRQNKSEEEEQSYGKASGNVEFPGGFSGGEKGRDGKRGRRAAEGSGGTDKRPYLRGDETEQAAGKFPGSAAGV